MEPKKTRKAERNSHAAKVLSSISNKVLILKIRCQWEWLFKQKIIFPAKKRIIMIIITIKQKDNTSLKKDPKGTIEIIDKNGKNATATKIYSKDVYIP